MNGCDDNLVALSDIDLLDLTQYVRFNKEESTLLKDLLVVKNEDKSFSLDFLLIEMLANFNQMHKFHSVTNDPRYQELIVKNSSYQQIHFLSNKLNNQHNLTDIKQTVYNWIFKYGFSKAIYRFCIVNKIPFNSKFPALSKHCVSNILLDWIFERLHFEKTEKDIKKIKEFEDYIFKKEVLAFKKLEQTVCFVQRFVKTKNNKLPKDHLSSNYVKKIKQILLLHYLVFELFPIKTEPNEVKKTVNLFKLSESYFVINKKFYKKVITQGIDGARKLESQEYSLLDYMPRVIRMIILSYQYHCSPNQNGKNNTFTSFFSELDGLWNINRAASFLFHNSNNEKLYKKRCFFVCKLITNYIETNNFNYKVGSLSLIDE